MTIFVKKKNRKRSNIIDVKYKKDIGVSAIKMGETCIKDLQQGQKNLKITCIVLDIGNAVYIANEKREVRTLKVADSTACINLAVWGDAGKFLNPGDIIKITKAKVSLFKNALTLYTTRYGTLQKTGEFCMVFNEQVNMSEAPENVKINENNLSNNLNNDGGNLPTNGSGNQTHGGGGANSSRYGPAKPSNLMSNITPNLAPSYNNMSNFSAAPSIFSSNYIRNSSPIPFESITDVSAQKNMPPNTSSVIVSTKPTDPRIRAQLNKGSNVISEQTPPTNSVRSSNNECNSNNNDNNPMGYPSKTSVIRSSILETTSTNVVNSNSVSYYTNKYTGSYSNTASSSASTSRRRNTSEQDGGGSGALYTKNNYNYSSNGKINNTEIVMNNNDNNITDVKNFGNPENGLRNNNVDNNVYSNNSSGVIKYTSKIDSKQRK